MGTTTTDERSDSELLLAFAREGEEATFEALAARHVDLIFAASLRRSGNRQMAEEATQNVLVGLSVKAKKLSAREHNLTGWLHKSTGFEVARLQRRESRLKKREQAYAKDTMKTATCPEDESLEQWYPLLDEAIDHLHASDREVIVRRYLEGQNFRRIGRALGVSEDAAQKRTSRALGRLNRFFRRKAGVTVSATTLVAGLSQNAIEAAPAACLNLAGKTASIGLASVITTTIFTTMSLTKITTITAGVLVLGGALGYLANRDDAPPESQSPPVAGSSAGNPVTPQPEQTPVVDGKDNKEIVVRPGPSAEEQAKWEAMSPHPTKDEFVRRLSVKHDQLLKDLTRDLGLSPAKAGSFKKVLDRRLEAFRAALEHGPESGDGEEEAFRKEGELVTRAGRLIRGVGLREELADLLTDDQLAVFDEREAKDRQREVESHAYTEFAELGPVLDLTEQQKDQAFELLQQSSAKILEADADARAFLALQKGQSPTQMELTDPAEMKLLAEVFENPSSPKPGSPAFEEVVIEVVGKRIDERVGLLAPVLTDQQKQRYRDHLAAQSILADFGIKLPSPDGK